MVIECRNKTVGLLLNEVKAVFEFVYEGAPCKVSGLRVKTSEGFMDLKINNVETGLIKGVPVGCIEGRFESIPFSVKIEG